MFRTLLVIYCLCWGLQAHADTLSNYLPGWEAHLASYKKQIDDQKAALILLQQSQQKVNLEVQQDPWAVLVAQVFDTTKAIREIEVTQGRYNALAAFIESMKGRPTPGVMEAWFVRESDGAISDMKVYQKGAEEYLAVFDDRVRAGPSHWIPPAIDLAWRQGRAFGIAEELKVLYKQASIYYRDAATTKPQEPQYGEQLQSAASVFVNLGAAILSMGAYQRQMASTMNRQRTCHFNRIAITCF